MPGIKLPVLTADKGSDEKALKIIAKDNKHGNIFLIILTILSVLKPAGDDKPKSAEIKPF